MSVASCSFEEIGDVIAGQHIAAALYNGDRSGTPYITGPADFGGSTPTVTKWTSSPKVMATSTDVLLTVKGNGVGKCNLGANAAIGRQLMALRPDPNALDQMYLYHFIASRELQISRLGQGATVPGIGKDDVAGLQIPLPPLSEQKRIAGILDKADAIRRKRQQAIALTEQFLRSTFLEMFGDPVTNPKGWSVMTFEQAPLQIIDGDRGKAYPRSEDFAPLGHCLFLNTKNVTTDGLKFTESSFISAEKDAELRKGKLIRNDVVLTTRGTVGNVGVYDARVPYDHLRINSGMVILRPDTSELRPQFLYQLLRSPIFSTQVDRILSGSAQPQLPIRSLNDVKLIIPPIGKQDEAVELCESVETRRRSYLVTTEITNNLFNSLVQRAFRGEL